MSGKSKTGKSKTGKLKTGKSKTDVATVQDAVKIYGCQYCRKSCFSAEELEEHEKKHTENKKLKCKHCKKGFSRRSYLAEHMAIHQGKLPYTCKFCDRKFHLHCNLVRHTYIHTGVKRFKCDYCEKRFILKKNMIEHRRKHTGEKPFDCPRCDKVFSRRSSKVRHYVTHTDIKLFECNYCGKAFPWKYYLTRHIETHMRPPKVRGPRKRRTKAEIARDKAVQESSQDTAKGYVSGGVKIEEGSEETTTRVFLPDPVPNHNYEFEGVEDVKEEVPVSELPPIPTLRPLCVVIPPLPETRLANEKKSDAIFPIVEIKEEVIDVEEEKIPTVVSGTVQNKVVCNGTSAETRASSVIVFGGNYKVTKGDFDAIQKRKLIVELPKI